MATKRKSLKSPSKERKAPARAPKAVKVTSKIQVDCPGEDIDFGVKASMCESGCCMNLVLTRVDEKPLTAEQAILFFKEVMPQVLEKTGLPPVQKPDGASATLARALN